MSLGFPTWEAPFISISPFLGMVFSMDFLSLSFQGSLGHLKNEGPNSFMFDVSNVSQVSPICFLLIPFHIPLLGGSISTGFLPSFPGSPLTIDSL